MKNEAHSFGSNNWNNSSRAVTNTPVERESEPQPPEISDLGRISLPAAWAKRTGQDSEQDFP